MSTLAKKTFTFTVKNTQGAGAFDAVLFNKQQWYPFTIQVYNPHPVAKEVKLFNAFEDQEDVMNEVEITIEKGWMSHRMLKRHIAAGIHYGIYKIIVNASSLQQLANNLVAYSVSVTGHTNATEYPLRKFYTPKHTSLQVSLDMKIQFTGKEGLQMFIEPQERVQITLFSDRMVSDARYEESFREFKQQQEAFAKLDAAQREEKVAAIMETDPELFLAMLGGEDALRQYVIHKFNQN